ncbi:hypothetical protein GGX14DRAFT_651531 [Mycena pura]|uniref:Uncharacterized protein n=1 Tax=Mycena pura TaxID=153505 RepID=A0AAD6V9D1_9AGAR|nr:hypothetical protein GGX14DRAFT_651531 [Mycena pura]
MVFQMRNRDGVFEQWRPAGSSSSSPKASSLGAASDGSPPTKRPRHEPVTPNAPSSSYPSSSSSASLLQATPSSYYIETSASGASVPASSPAKRFFMVDRKRFEGELKEEFQVLRSTGNVYTVTIQRHQQKR